MNNRRFNEAEVAEIFERAAELQHTGNRQIPPSEGMTLSQLQEIGREVGISPESLTLAAQAVEGGGQPTSRYFLGLPTGVGMSADLGREVSDQEWERIVVDLRETFDARGKLSQEGSFRQWTNGNLQALLEPTPTGHRLRLRTVKGDARGLMARWTGNAGIRGHDWHRGCSQGRTRRHRDDHHRLVGDVRVLQLRTRSTPGGCDCLSVIDGSSVPGS